MPGPSSLPECAVRFRDARKRLLADLAAGRAPSGFVRPASDLADRYFSNRLAEIDTGGTRFALAAVGGYGRRELCPCSDLDVLLLFKDNVPDAAAEISKALFLPLWDLGLDVGHGVRSIADCLDLAAKDFQVFASFIDMRFLDGDKDVFDALAARLGGETFPACAGPFLSWLERRNLAGKKRFGDAGAMLEPNLKEGLGGLRTHHQTLWLMKLAKALGRSAFDAGNGRARFASTWNELAEHADFLLRVRSLLHLLARRKRDVFHFEFQERTASLMGYEDKGPSPAVELFLGDLLRRMSDVESLRRTLWPALAAALGVEEESPPRPMEDGVESGPEGLAFSPGLSPEKRRDKLMRLFRLSAEHGLPPTYETKKQARAAADDIAERVAASPDSGFGRRTFEDMLDILMRDAQGTASAAMLETGLLGAILPEFKRVADLALFDVYHVHPVGRHTLEALDRLRMAARSGHPFHAAYARVRDPKRLFLGALLHDIGKGLGGGHAEKGARIAEDILARFGLDPDAAADVVFLVRNHLLPAYTAASRDLSDRDVLDRCARRVGTVDRLDMLLLLTWADSEATGPSAWSSWKEGLVRELHGKLRAMLGSESYMDAHDAHKMLTARDKVRALARGAFDPQEVEDRLEQTPPRYLIATAPEDIVRHLGMLRELDAAIAEDKKMVPRGRGGRGVAVLDPARPDNGRRVTVAAKKAPRLFTTLAGVLALHDINIHSAEAWAWEDDAAIHVFRVSDPPDTLFPDETWARVRRAVKYAQTGKLSLDYRLARKRRSVLSPAQPQALKTAPEVKTDNNASARFTLLEISADDRIGLLYDIARAMAELSLEVRLAKISTAGDRVRDVFYVRDQAGEKITDTAHLEEIRAAVKHALTGDA